MTERAQDVVMREWMSGQWTMEQIGQKHGITRERVRQLVVAATEEESDATTGD